MKKIINKRIINQKRKRGKKKKDARWSLWLVGSVDWRRWGVFFRLGLGGPIRTMVVYWPGGNSSSYSKSRIYTVRNTAYSYGTVQYGRIPGFACSAWHIGEDMANITKKGVGKGIFISWDISSWLQSILHTGYRLYRVMILQGKRSRLSGKTRQDCKLLLGGRRADR